MERYTASARAEQQPRICDFLPARQWTLCVWYLVGLTLVVAHATMYSLRLYLSDSVDTGALQSLQLTGVGTLASWTSSVLLLVSAILAAVILQFRRHKVDDYRGRYRDWYYVIGLLLLGSVDATTASHVIVWNVLQRVIQLMSVPYPHLWVLGPAALITFALVVRTIRELQASRAAVSTAILAGLMYLAAVSLQHEVLPAATPLLATLLTGSCLLMGHYLLTMSLAGYARFVYLDAQGLVSAKPARKKTAKKKKARAKSAPEESQTTAKTTQPKADDEKPRKQSTRPIPQTDTGADDDSSQEGEEQPSTLKMSKAERRKLRKQRSHEQRRAA